MAVTSKFPTNLGTMTDYTDSGMGREKSNDKDANDLTKNILGPEYSQMAGELIATQKKVGTDLSEPPSYGDDCADSHDEILRYLAWRADKAGVWEHFVFNGWTTAIAEDVGAVGTFASVDGGIGVGSIVTAAGVATGFDQNRDCYHQHSVYMRARVRFAALPATNGDVIEVGIYTPATPSYVRFQSTRAAGAWPVFTVEIDDGAGGTDSDVLTISPAIDTWYTFEILTTNNGATFWASRKDAAEEKKALTAAAPEDAYCRFGYYVTSTVGGETIYCDLIGAADTRTL